MGSFDTWMAGDPDSVEQVADWLRSVRSSLILAADNTSRVRGTSGRIWEGDAANAYRDFNKDMTRVLDQMASQIARVNDVFLSYAQQLRWRQEDMQEHRDAAVAGGLVVSGTVVYSPTPVLRPGELPPGATTEQRAEHRSREAAHERFVAADELYARLLEATARTFQQLTDWIAVNLVGAEEKLELTGLASAASLALASVGYSNIAGKATIGVRSDQLRAKALTKATEAARRASGNPAVRAETSDPNPRAVAKRMAASQTAARAAKAARASKYLGHIGGVVTAATAGLEISQGASPSTVAVGIMGGAIGVTVGTQMGLSGGAALAATILSSPGAAPVGAVVGAPIGAAIGAGVGNRVASMAYVTAVPQHARELVDEGLHDAWSSLTCYEACAVGIRAR